MNIFKETLNGNVTSRPPVWFMRQAGRVLPSYLKLRETYSFQELMADPVLTAKVTMLPVYDLDVDAAILFSDILVIPEALGMKLNFTDKGPKFDNPLTDAKNQLSSLKADTGKLEHIYKGIDIIVKEKTEDKALIGFCGAPFTTFCYMVEGNSANHNFKQAINLFYKDPKTTESLLERITELSIEYALNQVKHGIDAFQLFDTHAGLIPYEVFIKRVLPFVKKINNAIRDKGIKVIYFPKDIAFGLSKMNYDIADFISIDWQTSIYDARKLLDNRVGVQGNLDPRLLSVDNEEEILKSLERLRDFGKMESKWIFNTGHGLMPDNILKNVKLVIDWIKTTDWKR